MLAGLNEKMSHILEYFRMWLIFCVKLSLKREDFRFAGKGINGCCRIFEIQYFH